MGWKPRLGSRCFQYWWLQEFGPAKAVLTCDRPCRFSGIYTCWGKQVLRIM